MQFNACVQPLFLSLLSQKLKRKSTLYIRPTFYWCCSIVRYKNFLARFYVLPGWENNSVSGILFKVEGNKASIHHCGISWIICKWSSSFSSCILWIRQAINEFVRELNWYQVTAFLESLSLTCINEIPSKFSYDFPLEKSLGSKKAITSSSVWQCGRFYQHTLSNSCPLGIFSKFSFPLRVVSEIK